MLTGAGYTVLAAGRPEDALALAARDGDAIDALVTDIVMPGMSGLELAERLAPLRALFISGYSAEAAERRGGLPPGSAFLEKPFDHGALLAEVRALLDSPAPHRVPPMIDESTDLGALVARHLREDRIVWLTTVTPGGAPAPQPGLVLVGRRRTPCTSSASPTPRARATSRPTRRSR